MKKEFIPYEQALALKELGFDEPCFGYYLDEKLNIFHSTSVNDRINSKTIEIFRSDVITSPTFSQAFRFFREKYNLIPNIHSIYSDETHTEIKFWFWFGNYEDDSDDEVFYGTYEESELECLKKLIQIVKEQK